MINILERQTRIANIIDSVAEQVRYDSSVKAVISNKSILSWILKCCVKEFEPFDISTIFNCIEGTPEVSIKAVHRNEADMLDGNTEIKGDNCEDSSTTEQRITYDIRFTAVVPNTDKVVALIINIEAQTSNEGYPIEKRVIYYLSRLISGQYGTVFTHSHYEKIRKVYSIWFCTDVPKYKKNTISGISLHNDAIFGNASLNPEATDLMQGIIVNLGNPEEPVDNTILKLMNTLLSVNVNAEEKKRVMKNDFNIAITEKFEKEVSDMCNLSQGILNMGKAEGRAEGKAEGRAEGKAEGKAEGIQTEKKTIALKLHSMGMSDLMISNAVDAPLEDIKKWIEEKLS